MLHWCDIPNNKLERDPEKSEKNYRSQLSHLQDYLLEIIEIEWICLLKTLVPIVLAGFYGLFWALQLRKRKLFFKKQLAIKVFFFGHSVLSFFYLVPILPILPLANLPILLFFLSPSLPILPISYCFLVPLRCIVAKNC
jgi:hypothetical protein